jgi:hypothetical protein
MKPTSGPEMQAGPGWSQEHLCPARSTRGDPGCSGAHCLRQTSGCCAPRRRRPRCCRQTRPVLSQTVNKTNQRPFRDDPETASDLHLLGGATCLLLNSPHCSDLQGCMAVRALGARRESGRSPNRAWSIRDRLEQRQRVGLVESRHHRLDRQHSRCEHQERQAGVGGRRRQPSIKSTSSVRCHRRVRWTMVLGHWSLRTGKRAYLLGKSVIKAPEMESRR